MGYLQLVLPLYHAHRPKYNHHAVPIPPPIAFSLFHAYQPPLLRLQIRLDNDGKRTKNSRLAPTWMKEIASIMHGGVSKMLADSHRSSTGAAGAGDDGGEGTSGAAPASDAAAPAAGDGAAEAEEAPAAAGDA